MTYFARKITNNFSLMQGFAPKSFRKVDFKEFGH